MVSNHSKHVQNRLKEIAMDYQSGGLKVATAFRNGAFEHLMEWRRSDLLIDLITCATDSNAPRAENTIRFVKKRLRSIQSETPYIKYPKRLTVEMAEHAIVLIKLFRRKSRVHPMMSLRQILFSKKVKTPLYKMKERVMAYNVKANNKILRLRAFYELYIGPNDGGTGHSVFKLSTKRNDYHTEMETYAYA